jgi:hypothetical protein
MGLLSSANRCGCNNLLSCNLLRRACCCSWIRHVCGRKEATHEASTSSETKRKKRKWLRGFWGGTVQEAEEPLTSESKKKKKNPTTTPEPEKGKWIKKRIWKKKKKEKVRNEQIGLANLVKEISLSSNNPSFISLSDFPFESMYGNNAFEISKAAGYINSFRTT